MGDVETVAKDKLKIAAFPANYFEHTGPALSFKGSREHVARATRAALA